MSGSEQDKTACKAENRLKPELSGYCEMKRRAREKTRARNRIWGKIKIWGYGVRIDEKNN